MRLRSLVSLTVAIVAVFVLCAGGLGGLFGGGSDAGMACLPIDISPSASTTATTAPIAGLPPGNGDWDSDQMANAATIVATGARLGVPTRGWVISVATAIQESGLRNLPGGDRDSVGLFQQRPSQGWGTPTQLQDPAYAAGKFYEKLVTIGGWETMPLTEAAQAVQRSAFPDAYAKHESAASQLVTAVASGLGIAILGSLGQCVSPCPSATGTSPSSCVDGPLMLARAATWLTAWDGGPVPYLSSGDSSTWFDGYRRDCSGYVSMALGLSGPGLNTAGLADASVPITKTDLRPGDLLINPATDSAGHVVIFERWTDPTMTTYVGYEQSGDGGTHHRSIPYPYFGTYAMSPYRFTG